MILYMMIMIAIMQFKSLFAINCPDVCSCTWFMTNLKVNCSGVGIKELPDFEDLPIETLDLSDNLFTEFPTEISKIETLIALDLSNNLISKLDRNTFLGCRTLKFLLLGRNNITNWMDINPNTLLLPAMSLHTLSLAGNPITSFSSSDENFILMSNSLLVLDLSNCKITKVSGQFVLQGLMHLERLILSGNPLRSLSHITSDSLQILDVSNCNLGSLLPNTFNNMKSLFSVNFSRNPTLSLTTKLDYVKSISLKRIDLSYCNMDTTKSLRGFPNLTLAILKGNMLRQLSFESFINNFQIEYMDLSFNAIQNIENNAFHNLKQLKHLDLSFNMIARIDRNTFKSNEILTSVNLSRNFITKLNKIFVTSLINLNMSWCEIITIDNDAFDEILNIKQIDLSNNLISDFPENIKSKTLEVLDLSTCRLSRIRNSTFHGFPELSSLNLASNRFTTFKVNYFNRNQFLEEIWMGDNPWICNCQDTQFRDLFQYLTQHPMKVMDKKHLRCASPENALGRTWESVCYSVWFPSYRSIGTNEKIWTIVMLSLIAFSVGLCITMGIKKCITGRKRFLNNRELERNLEESRVIHRHNQMVLEQRAQLNAPDPRESNPPCYEDAVLLPPVKHSKSMVELHSKRKHENKSNKSDSNDADEVDNGLILDQHRYRSEEILSVRDRERTVKFAHKRSDRIEPYSRSGSQTRLPRNQSNLESIEKIKIFDSYENSPYSRRRPKDDAKELMTSASMRSFEDLGSNSNSPYTRRRPKDRKSYLQSSSFDEAVIDPAYLNLVDNYYNETESSNSESGSNNFQMMTLEEIDYTLDQLSDSQEEIVIVHHNAKESQL